jgi:hypothetical protein
VLVHGHDRAGGLRQPGRQGVVPRSVAGVLPEAFGVAAPAFRVQSTLACGSAWPSRSALWVRGSCRVMEDLLESSQGGLPVAPLRTMLSCDNRDHTAYQAAFQRGQRPVALRRRERRRSSQVERQLDPGVAGVDGLPAGTAGTGEAPVQVGGRDLDPANDERLHESMVTDPAPPAVRRRIVGQLRLPGQPFKRPGSRVAHAVATTGTVARSWSSSVWPLWAGGAQWSAP